MKSGWSLLCPNNRPDNRPDNRSSIRVALKADLFALLVLIFTLGANAQIISHQNIGQAAEFVPGEIIVKLRGKAKSLESRAFVGKAVSEKAMTHKGSWAGLNLHHFSLKAGQSVESMIDQLKSDPEVLYAEPNYIVRRQSAGFEGQPVPLSEIRSMASEQAHAVSDPLVIRFSQTNAPIQLSQAWSAVSQGRDPVVVAVIDTGLDLNHDVFIQSNAIWLNSDEVVNGMDDDGNGYIDDIRGWNFVAGSNSPQDDDGHGTHVSGIVLGATQDISATPLSQALIRIMPLKFLDSTGSGSTSDAIKAIYYAVNNGAKVLNNSWGGGGYSSSLLEAIAYAYDHKLVVVAAAGNASTNNDALPIYPANYTVPSMISIAATSDLDGFAGFSNYGVQSVHMGAPGVSVLSTLPGNMFGRSSGTSMATPFVSGVAALMLRETPNMSGYQVKNLIFAGAQSIASLQTRTITKARLNVHNAVIAAKSTSVDGSQPVFVASSSGARAPDSIESSVAGCGLIGRAVNGSSGATGGLTKTFSFFALMLLLVSPILVSLVLRRKDGRNRRRHERYYIDSAVTLRFGDREISGKISTISLGGVQVNTDAWLDNGGIVKMSIRSPDGKDQIEVEGQIVWSEEKKRYGVAFSHSDDPIRATISRWTAGLLKA